MQVRGLSLLPISPRPSLIKATEEPRAAGPEKFEETLVRGAQVVGFGFSPASAIEFVEILNRTVQRDMECGVTTGSQERRRR